MKTLLVTCLTLALGATLAHAQASALDLDPPTPTTPQAPVTLNPMSPLQSLEQQAKTASFDQRSAFLTAFDQANQSVDTKVAEIRSRGLVPTDEALTALDDARLAARQTFRDMSLTTVETWDTARTNAVSVLRRLRVALEDVERSTIQPGGV